MDDIIILRRGQIKRTDFARILPQITTLQKQGHDGNGVLLFAYMASKSTKGAMFAENVELLLKSMKWLAGNRIVPEVAVMLDATFDFTDTALLPFNPAPLVRLKNGKPFLKQDSDMLVALFNMLYVSDQDFLRKLVLKKIEVGDMAKVVSYGLGPKPGNSLYEEAAEFIAVQYGFKQGKFGLFIPENWEK